MRQDNLARGTNLGGKPKGAHAKHLRGQTNNQVGSKMIKGEGNDMGRAEDMGVVGHGREQMQREET